MTNVRVRLLVAMGVLLVGLLVLATQCPNANSLVAVFSASPTSGTSPLTVNFDASSSSAPDGSILTYDWIFGDGDTATGETISHTYRQPGIYTAQLAVTDDNGSMDSTSCEITVTAAVGTPPSAGFTATPSSGEVPLAVNFNASASFDPDGSIASYAWSFDDGGSGSGPIVTHTYTSADTYYPLLCVTDDDGNQDYAAQTVHVLSSPSANNPPVASFTASPTSGQAPLAVSFNASGSSDSDGSITSYAWSFGDGGSSSGVTASHTYNSAGTYTARLTVTDDDGSTDSATRTIQVSSTPVANNPPTASFTASPTSGQAPLGVSFNASGSSDSDGSITSYAWSFGDGGSGSGVTATYTYNSTGTYTAQLIVTDDDGATDTTTTQIEVSASSVPEDLYVDANSGSDAAGDGTQVTPYKTITKAVTMAVGYGGLHVVHVGPGVYNTELGEEVPISLGDGISLIGEGATREDVKVVPRLECGTDSSIARIHSYTEIEVRASSKRVVLDDIVVTGSGDGMGVRIHTDAEVRITNASVANFLDGIFMGGAGTSVTIEDSKIESSIGIAIRWGATANVHSNIIKNCTSGLYVLDNSTAIIVGNTISNNAKGVYVLEEAEVVMSGNVISSNSTAIQTEHTVTVDLGGGGLGSIGGNTIIGSSLHNINDARSAYSGSLFAKNNTWTDPQPSGTVNGPVDSPPNYFIENEGNSIIFSD